MMMSSVMPDQGTGAVGRIHIRAEFWNVLAVNAPLLLMLNNLTKMDKNRTLFTVSAVAAKVRKLPNEFSEPTKNDLKMTET